MLGVLTADVFADQNEIKMVYYVKKTDMLKN